MQKRLTTRQRKNMVADYYLCNSYSETARKYKCSPNTVKRVVNDDRYCGEFGEKVQAKKNEMETDILAHMDTKKDQVCLIIDKYLAALLDDAKIASATTNQLTTALGTVIDKFTMARQASSTQQGGIIEIPSVIPVEEERNGNMDSAK